MRPTGRLAGPTAVAGVLVLAVVGAAVAAPWRMETRNWSSWDAYGRRPALPSAPAQPSGWPSTPITSNSHPMNLSWIVPVLLVIAALAVLALLRFLWRRYRASGVERRGAREVGATLILPSTPELPVLLRGATAARRSLDEIADPNNAIVAAWLALEEAAASSGVRRQPAETPTEFTVDVLGATRADPAATQELLALYHRARFSTAGVNKADVRAAIHCLVVLAGSWEALTDSAVDAAVAAGGRPARPAPPSTPGSSSAES